MKGVVYNLELLKIFLKKNQFIPTNVNVHTGHHSLARDLNEFRRGGSLRGDVSVILIIPQMTDQHMGPLLCAKIRNLSIFVIPILDHYIHRVASPITHSLARRVIQ